MENLHFVNNAIKELALDPIRENYIRRVSACLSLVNPTGVDHPKLIHTSREALELLDITNVNKRNIEQFFSGNKLLPGSQPTAHCYCGHQFGSFSGQLGDGRAISLGEIVNRKGEIWELQLKGSGKTPYSRHADGRAVLRSSIREFLCSEAMHHLGIPTTRAATIVTSDTLVERDVKYDGNIIFEKATIISRIAPTFIRFGSFQIADPVDKETGRDGPSNGNRRIIGQLLNFVIKHHYSHIWKRYATIENRTIAFAQELTTKTAKMVALWQSVGFTHGVLNTDNMSILGLTMDYGPFAFLDDYDPNFVSNMSDTDKRYRFDNQAGICKWNLEKLFESIGRFLPHIRSRLKDTSESFCPQYRRFYLDRMRKKLGLFQSFPEDEQLVQSLLSTMHQTKADFTNIFRKLASCHLEEILLQTRSKSASRKSLWQSWLAQYSKRINKENNKDRVDLMNQHNPRYVLRNYIAQIAIDKAENGDYSEFKKLLDVLRDPFDKTGKYKDSNYDQLPPEWSAKLTLSCSS